MIIYCEKRDGKLHAECKEIKIDCDISHLDDDWVYKMTERPNSVRFITGKDKYNFKKIISFEERKKKWNKMMENLDFKEMMMKVMRKHGQIRMVTK